MNTLKKLSLIIKEYLILMLACMVAFVIVFFPVKEKETPFQEMEFSQISAIAELTTTINYYHDVVEIRDDPDLIFKFGLFRYGYKRLWMEYSGEVRMGVDASKIKVKNPDANNVVEIYVPKAEVLSAKVNHESLSEPIFETGWFTTITAEEKAEAVKLSQLNMEEKAKNDYARLDKAYMNAKNVIQDYVNKISEMTGIQYKIKWIK